MLTLIDEYTRRESLAIRGGRRLNSHDVIDTLADAMVERGVPEHIGSDNGPEFIATALRKWLSALGTSPLYIAPGRQTQAGFAAIRRGPDRLAVFIATLGWRRATYVEFVTDERIETLLACHERAFYYFGGVPREVLYDNMRTVATDRDRYRTGLHRYNRTFLDFAHHHGFVPAAVPAVSRQDQGQGRALHPLPARELLRAAAEPAQSRGT